MGRLSKAIDRITAGRRAKATIRAYDSDWRSFSAWCTDAGRESLPAKPATVALYLAEVLETMRVGTAERRVAAIRHKHLEQQLATPTDDRQISNILAGARREQGTRAAGKDAITPEQLRAMIAKQPKTDVGVRNKAILLFGFASAMRRSELSALDVDDLDILTKGVRVQIGRSKTDQEGKGRIIGVFRSSKASSCPVAALEKWMAIRGHKNGPLFTNLSPNATKTKARKRLGDRSIWKVVKNAAESIGLDATRYAPHSLRSGCITAAIEGGTAESVIMKLSGHKSLASVARYVRPATIWKHNPLQKALG
jgi:integrase